MSEQQITVTLEADASGCLRVIRQVTRSVDTLAGKKVGNAGMPELADGAQTGAVAQPFAQGAHRDGLAFARHRFHCRIDLFRAYFGRKDTESASG